MAKSTGAGPSSLTETESPALPRGELLPRRRHCNRWVCWGVLALLLLLTGVVVLVLVLTVFKLREPEVTIVSLSVHGISPSITFPAMLVELNITLDMDLIVHNPNLAYFSHAGGGSDLLYRGTRVGDATMEPGRVPPRGRSHIYSHLTLESERLATDVWALLGDVMAGRLALDSATRIPGYVTVLGFIKKNAVIFSDCHVVTAFPQLTVVDQVCRQRTKL